MDAMPMSAGGMAQTAWMPLCGQSWIAAAAAFLAMWTVMMAAMMLPSLIPMLRRYRASVGRAGESPRAFSTALVAGGYWLVWALLGAAIYPLGSAITVVTARHAELARAAPIASALVVLLAGALQLTRWKARHLACCRDRGGRASLPCGCALPADASSALRHGLQLGLHCTQSCAGLTAVLLVSGIMEMPAMIAVTAGITLERLAPAGERVARAIGMMVAGAGVFLIVRAAGLH